MSKKMVLETSGATFQVGCASLDDALFCISQITYHNKIQILLSVDAPMLHSA